MTSSKYSKAGISNAI
jgi:hypothetical protein